MPDFEPTTWWTLLTLGAWIAFSLWCRVLLRNPRGDVDAGLALLGMKVYSRLVHGLRVSGVEHRPSTAHAGPLIVVANHTAGIDPILMQAVCPFEIRFLMAEDMQIPELRAIWAWTRVIPVSRAEVRAAASGAENGRRSGGDARAALRALRHLKNGGVLGVFPEGGIERPPGNLLPFLPGIGFLVRRSAAPVLPVVITGTPLTRTAWGSFFRPSRARIRFLPVVHAARDASPEAIAADLEDRFRAALAGEGTR